MGTPYTAILELECIGDDCHQMMRQMYGFASGLGGDGFASRLIGKPPKPRWWVAELVDIELGPRKFERHFLHGQKDYSHANSVGSRGVMAVYVLEGGKAYEVSSPVSWKNTDRYYCCVDEGQIVRLTEEQVVEWLSMG